MNGVAVFNYISVQGSPKACKVPFELCHLLLWYTIVKSTELAEVTWPDQADCMHTVLAI